MHRRSGTQQQLRALDVVGAHGPVECRRAVRFTYVDAHVLKWRPIGTLLGLETVYELDRISGRYQSLTDEQTQERTVYSLAANKPFDAFDLARRYWVLRPFVDAEYGSATFIGATARGGSTYELRVSTTGLLVRPSRTK